MLQEYELRLYTTVGKLWHSICKVIMATGTSSGHTRRCIEGKMRVEWITVSVNCSQQSMSNTRSKTEMDEPNRKSNNVST